ncbi:tail fiber assembly protein [Pseudomonas kribbensis]|uniref:tail fiber assembly protein n=1 Tax=Pseudomonas kribbensis TaxID=1628086 RepID=UPI001F18A422|nr:tail fiber assembly protein [Pseudomonas kribbensis]UIN53628.1 tail fiber assembly protein [Pseudomonas kribbensis]
MPYAITNTGWRAIGEGWELAQGETYIEDLPEWLLMVTEGQRIEASARMTLNYLMYEADKVIQPLQDDYDVGDITDDNLSRWKAWKGYRSALGKTPERAGWLLAPDWPAIPAI